MSQDLLNTHILLDKQERWGERPWGTSVAVNTGVQVAELKLNCWSFCVLWFFKWSGWLELWKVSGSNKQNKEELLTYFTSGGWYSFWWSSSSRCDSFGAANSCSAENSELKTQRVVRVTAACLTQPAFLLLPTIFPSWSWNKTILLDITLKQAPMWEHCSCRTVKSGWRAKCLKN